MLRDCCGAGMVGGIGGAMWWTLLGAAWAEAVFTPEWCEGEGDQVTVHAEFDGVDSLDDASLVWH